jgi:hypothetical protein
VVHPLAEVPDAAADGAHAERAAYIVKYPVRARLAAARRVKKGPALVDGGTPFRGRKPRCGCATHPWSTPDMAGTPRRQQRPKRGGSARTDANVCWQATGTRHVCCAYHTRCCSCCRHTLARQPGRRRRLEWVSASTCVRVCKRGSPHVAHRTRVTPRGGVKHISMPHGAAAARPQSLLVTTSSPSTPMSRYLT